MTKAKKVRQGKTNETPTQQVIPQWAVQPYLYQTMLLKWFEAIYEGLKEIHSVLEKIESNQTKD